MSSKRSWCDLSLTDARSLSLDVSCLLRELLTAPPRPSRASVGPAHSSLVAFVGVARTE